MSHPHLTSGGYYSHLRHVTAGLSMEPVQQVESKRKLSTADCSDLWASKWWPQGQKMRRDNSANKRPAPPLQGFKPPPCSVKVSYSTKYYKKVTITELAIPPVQDRRIKGQNIVPNDFIRCSSWGVIQTAPRVTQAVEGNCSRAERKPAALQSPHTPRPLK